MLIPQHEKPIHKSYLSTKENISVPLSKNVLNNQAFVRNVLQAKVPVAQKMRKIRNTVTVNGYDQPNNQKPQRCITHNNPIHDQKFIFGVVKDEQYLVVTTTIFSIIFTKNQVPTFGVSS